MKIKNASLLLSIILLFSISICAQYEWETVYNPRTNQQEQQYNPYNSIQQAYERQQQARREQYDQQTRERNERYRRYEEERQEMARQQQLNFMELNSKMNYGRAIINAGKANTVYKISPNFSLKNYFLQKAKSAELKQMVMQYADVSLKQFRDELTKRGLSQNDFVDGKVLAFVIAYEVYFGEKPTSAHLTWARQATKNYYLKEAYFQSTDDMTRQQNVEISGALAMYAKSMLAKGDADSVREARSVAKSVLESIWQNGVETIAMTKGEFVHRGRLIIASGKATNLYKHNPNMQTAEIFIKSQSEFRKEMVQESKQNLQLFYQVLAQKGGQKNDLAWCGTMVAYANFLVITNGQDWNSAQFNSAYNFVKKAVLNSPDIQAASDEVRQLACESLAIETAMNYRNFAKGGSEAMGTNGLARQILGKLFEVLGEDVNKYQWTATGIVKVK